MCRLTDVADDLARAGFTRKRGGTFLWGSNPQPWTFTFALSPRLVGPTSFAYQVERAKFDQILLDHARRTGAVARQAMQESTQVQLQALGEGEPLFSCWGGCSSRWP